MTKGSTSPWPFIAATSLIIPFDLGIAVIGLRGPNPILSVSFHRQTKVSEADQGTHSNANKPRLASPKH
jgi:hypothetical protein